MMLQLAAIAFAAVTFPIWGGAIAMLMAGGITLALTHPWVLLLIFLAPFILRAFV
jgi:uncharacterized protein (DUF697 family)